MLCVIKGSTAPTPRLVPGCLTHVIVVCYFKHSVIDFVWRRGGLMVNALVSGASDPGSSLV